MRLGKFETNEKGEKILTMRQSVQFTIERGYKYRQAFAVRLLRSLARTVAFPLLLIFDNVVYGFTVKGIGNAFCLGRSGAVTVCNHIHMMDCTMIDMALRLKRIYYLTLDSNFRIPGIRHLIRFFGGVPVTSSIGCTAELFSAMKEEIQRGACVQIYPEGYLVPYGKSIREFHPGAFHLAVSADSPVLPMVIIQKDPVFPRRLVKRKPCLCLNILPPIYPRSDLNRREAERDIQQRVYDAMIEAGAG